MSRSGIRVFAKCRNERLRLPAFLRHYRALGAERFFVVDNDSSDGSLEYLEAQPDVQVSRTSERGFDASRGGATWMNPLLARFGAGGWCLTVDIDELLVYPGSERTPLTQLTTHLDACGAEALACLLLDLYPQGPVVDAICEADADPIAVAPYFDRGPYSRVPGALCPGVVIRGGMRERVFYPERRRRGLVGRVARIGRAPAPCLTKVPLVRWDGTCHYLHSNHWVTPRVVAAETGVLLHCKFLHDFIGRALEEAQRGDYEDGAAEYRRYADVIRREPRVCLADRDSVRYEGSAQLVALGLLSDSDDWRRRRAAADPAP